MIDKSIIHLNKVKYLGMFTLLFIMQSCGMDKKPQTIRLKGDLFFPYLHSASFYGLPEAAREEYLNLVDSMGYQHLLETEPERTQWMLNLEKNDLLYSPYIHLKVEEDKTVIVFLDSLTYEDFKKYDYSELLKIEEKIEVEVEAVSVWSNLYQAQSAPRQTRVKGKTFAWDKKLLIRNYE